MSLNANNVKGGGAKRPAAPHIEAGTYPARLVQVILMGTQKQNPFKGEEKPPVMTLRVTYELLDEFMPDEAGNPDEARPRWISEEFPFHNLKADKAKSTKRYYALDTDGSAGGDWGALLGTPCMVTVVADKGKKPGDDRIYNKVSGISAMRPREAAKAEPLKNEAVVFDFYQPDMEIFNSLPQWIQDKMKEAVDYDGGALADAVNGGAASPKKAPVKKVTKEQPEQEELDDEIPFDKDEEEDW